MATTTGKGMKAHIDSKRKVKRVGAMGKPQTDEGGKHKPNTKTRGMDTADTYGPKKRWTRGKKLAMLAR